MRKIGNFIFTIILMASVVLVYLNVDKISDFIVNFMLENKKVIIKDSNEYELSYDYLFFSNDEDFIPYSYDDLLNIYYNVLNRGYKEFTFYCPKEYESCTEDIEKIADDEELMSNINGYVHPYNSFERLELYLSSLNEVTVQVIYKYSQEKIDAINSKIVEIIGTLDLTGKSDKDKISIIHNYIVSNSEYDKNKADGLFSPYDSSSAYGNLIEGFGVCSGYSDAMSIFLNYLNIPNIRVNSTNHVWNLVYLDGQWLHLDLTWDDVENKKYSNNYFLIPTDKLEKLDQTEHNFDREFFKEANY